MSIHIVGGLMQITKRLEWDMGHRVTDHDSVCRNLHGHRYVAEVTVAGPVSEQPGSSSRGMVLDFGDVKARLEDLIRELDHGMMLWRDDPIRTLMATHPLLVGLKLITFPTVPTAEHIAAWLLTQAEHRMPPGVHAVKVRLYETPTCWAEAVFDEMTYLVATEGPDGEARPVPHE